jgi:uncharacterized protein (DUF885 family)
MNKLLILSLLFGSVFFVSSCTRTAQTADQLTSSEADFEKFIEHYLDTYWELNPGYAIYVGNHAYDSVLQVPDEATRSWKLEQLKILADSLAEFDESTLPSNLRTDYWMMRDQVRSDIWYINDYRSHEWNPASYNIGGGIGKLLNDRNLDISEKVINIGGRLRRVPDYYTAAISGISDPTFEHTELAILQNEGTRGLLTGSLKDSILSASLPEDLSMELMALTDSAVSSIDMYLSFLKGMISDKSDDSWRSFRLGEELYNQKFSHDIQSRFTAQEMYNKALERKDELQGQMAAIARELWPEYMGDSPMPDDDVFVVRSVIDAISVNHVHRDSFMIAIEKQIPELEQFVTEKDLIYLDPEKPLVVRKTPSYMEGSGAGASISSPGPYDKYGDTYYNVSPLTNYSDEHAESYLREYNHYILQILNIHEAVPGHYTQLVYANNSPSLIKSIFGNGAMVEGWAVYSELMMLENGYGNDEPEMWLMYYKWHLRSVCNTILDYSVHVLGMNEEDAKDLLTRQAFQEEAEAAGKWRRVKLSQVQLTSYFTGFHEIYGLREEMKEQLGSDFSLRKFHEDFLSYGSAPVKYIHRLMTGK